MGHRNNHLIEVTIWHVAKCSLGDANPTSMLSAAFAITARHLLADRGGFLFDHVVFCTAADSGFFFPAISDEFKRAQMLC